MRRARVFRQSAPARARGVMRGYDQASYYNLKLTEETSNSIQDVENIFAADELFLSHEISR